MAATHFDSTSPERGRPPFLDWLRDHDLDPADVRSVSVEDLSAAATVMVRGNDGYPVVDGNELRTRTRTVPLQSNPPLHPDREA